MSQDRPCGDSSVPSPGGVRAEREDQHSAGEKGPCAGEATPNDVFREVFARSPIGLAVLTPTLHWLEINDSLLDIFGLNRQELRELPLRRLLRRYRLVGAITIIRRLAAGDGGPFTLPVRLTRPDGETREIEARIQRLPLKGPAMDLIVLEVKDLTVEAELMRAARGSAVFLRQVVDLIPHFVFAKDGEGRFLLVNRAVAEAYGTPAIHILGKTDRHFSASEAEARAFIADDLEVIRSARPKVIPEERITTAGGDTRLLQTTKIPFAFAPANQPGVLGVSVDITELRRTEEELRQRTEELDHFFSIALDLLCIADTDGIFHRVNREWERLLGYAQSDLEGRSFLDFVHPDDREATLAAIERLRQQERVLDFVNRYRRRDGTYRYLEWRSIPVGKLIFAAARDITDRIRTEEVLRTSRQMLQNVLDHFPGVVFWKDTHSVYMGCNRAFATAAGLDRPEEIVGKTDLELPWAHTDAESYLREDREVMETGSAKLGIIETQHTADGRVVWFSTNKIPLVGADGKVYGVLGTAVDITEMRKLEEQYRHAQRMEAVGQLAGGVAHDFNNLLQIITGYLELAQLKLAANQNAERELDEIRRATERASTLVRQLLAFGRRQVVRCEPVDLDTLVAGLSGMLRRLIDERVDLRIVSHGHLPKVFADPGQLEQIIVNLCVNARDAMPMGGQLVIGTALERLDHSRPLTDAHPGTYVVLSVADTGHGIPPQLLDRIFDPFFTTKEVGKGTGLGLATVYSIVKQHQGFIEVTSTELQGTVFRVFFPAAEGVPDKSGDEPPRVLSPGGGFETVLVAEDDRQVRELTAAALRASGYRVLEAGDGEEALEVLSRTDGEVDLFVLDAVMPRLSGRDLCAAVAARYPKAKFLFCTGYSFDELRKDGVAEATFEVLYKPFSSRQLQAKVQEVLARRG